MRATGIVRRIDDLGRVVIPKEIRRTLRIREGDPLEIYTESDGEVIFKKYSPLGELSRFAGEYAEVLHRSAGFPVLVTDRDRVVSAAGIPRKDVLERRLSPQLERLMDARECYRGSETFCPLADSALEAAAVFPVVAAGDVAGAVVLLKDENRTAGESEIKLTQVSASFLAKQLEE